MNDFLRGALVMASLSISLFFLRFWRSTHDRLFAIFSAAFCLLGLNWTIVTLAPALAQLAHVLRFLAFVLIALAVLDKNQQAKARG
jgi:Family of unknown function (DUF5985)